MLYEAVNRMLNSRQSLSSTPFAMLSSTKWWPRGETESRQQNMQRWQAPMAAMPRAMGSQLETP